MPDASPSDDKTFEYDVFISHSSKDKPVVRALAERLRADGVKVWFDDWVIPVGGSIPLYIELGLKESRTLLLVMSKHSFGSDWVGLERHSVLFRDPSNLQLRLRPLLLDDSPIPDMLSQFRYLDWQNPTDETYGKLLEAVRPVKSETLGEELTEPDEDDISRVLDGHTNSVLSVFMSSDGEYIVSGSEDNTIRVWRFSDGKCLKVLKGHTSKVWSVSLSSDGKHIVSGSSDKTIRVWRFSDGKCLKVLEGHTQSIFSLFLSLDGGHIVSASNDSTIRVWRFSDGKCLKVLKGHEGIVNAVSLSSDGKHIVSGSWDNTIRVWRFSDGKCLRTMEGHTSHVWSVFISSDDKHIVSASDRTIRVWRFSDGKCLRTMEGHTRAVRSVFMSSDGEYIVSGSDDGTIRVWDASSLKGASLEADEEATTYSNAKVLLVGDSGVGKSGLALRLTENRYELTDSTHGAWATIVALPEDMDAPVDAKREIWLWDFAGQSDYRLVHQLFMEETALAILVFNPQSDNPFEGLGQWERDITRASRRTFRKLLVAGRCDRGGAMVSKRAIEQFLKERGFADYLETSSLTGVGCQELREAIRRHIDWESIPNTVSPHIFRRLKEEILKLRDEGEKGKTLLRRDELKQQLEFAMPDEPFTVDEFKTVVSLLAGPGIVWQLDFGDFVLLRPEWINRYAGAVVRSVRAHPDEIGCIDEDKVLAGELDYQDMERLPAFEEEIVLRAMYQTFLKTAVCLREPTEEGNRLFFPSYFKRERPDLTDHPTAFVNYRFTGMLDEIYSSLVVRMHHTKILEKSDLWRNAADFKTVTKGQRVGVKVNRLPEGAGEITVYCDPAIPLDTRVAFMLYIHNHIQAKGNDVLRTRYYTCPHCKKPVDSYSAIAERLELGKKDVICARCENRFDIWDTIEEKFASEEIRRKVQEMNRQSSRQIDNQSRERILVGDVTSVVSAAGQIFRETPHSDWGIDGEIEFKNDAQQASGKRVYLQLKSGDSYLRYRKSDNAEIFDIPEERHINYWKDQNYDVYLVVRTADGKVRWMNLTEYLKRQAKPSRQVVFEGTDFTSANIYRLRDRLLGANTQ